MKYVTSDELNTSASTDELPRTESVSDSESFASSKYESVSLPGDADTQSVRQVRVFHRKYLHIIDELMLVRYWTTTEWRHYTL